MQVAYRESVKNNYEYVYEIDNPKEYLSLRVKLTKIEHQMNVEELEEVIHGQRFEELLATAEWKCQDSNDYQEKILIIRQNNGTKLEEEEFSPLSRMNTETKEKIMEDFKDALKRGIVLGYPLINLKIEVIDGIFSKLRTNNVVVNKSVAVCMRELLNKAEGMVFEPIMDVVFDVPDENIGDLISDISSNRRGAIIGVNKTPLGSQINAKVPLKEMLGYTSILRGISRGVGSMTMKFNSYEYVGKLVEEQLANK